MGSLLKRYMRQPGLVRPPAAKDVMTGSDTVSRERRTGPEKPKKARELGGVRSPLSP